MTRRGKWLVAAALAVLGPAGLSWAAGSILAAPRNDVVPAPEPPGRPVRLTTSDGVTIAGSYWPGAGAESPAVLLLHGINNDRRLFARHAEWLNGLGYAVLAIDLRGHGGSAAVDRTFGWRESEDAAAAYSWLKAGRPERKVGVIGVSLGGAAALLGAEGPLPADAMVLQAVYPDIRTAIVNRLDRIGSHDLARLGEPMLSYQSWPRYGVRPERIAPLAGLRRYRGTVLIIGGREDLSTRVSDSLALYRAAPGAKALWLVDGADHVETSTLWNAGYRARVRCLFDRALGEPLRHRSPAHPFGTPCATSPSS